MLVEQTKELDLRMQQMLRRLADDNADAKIAETSGDPSYPTVETTKNHAVVSQISTDLRSESEDSASHSATSQVPALHSTDFRPQTESTRDTNSEGGEKRVMKLPSSPRTRPQNGASECFELPSARDVVSPGVTYVSAASSPRDYRPEESEACVVAGSTMDILGMSMVAEAEDVKSQRLRILTHAPIGRRPPKPRSVQGA
eukprot:TRINITY_DN24129_c0_g1_i1.p1 TRINITY_DN24129_c0_g1~~TRINITY_DN24129_c0_g1_i1.p1  ORF type:complete len:200 (-),score=11.05 TRINITY_DN24129_c0_g1_i1:52-651(-)